PSGANCILMTRAEQLLALVISRFMAERIMMGVRIFVSRIKIRLSPSMPRWRLTFGYSIHGLKTYKASGPEDKYFHKTKPEKTNSITAAPKANLAALPWPATKTMIAAAKGKD